MITQEFRPELSNNDYATCVLTQTNGNGETRSFNSKHLNAVVYLQSQDKYTVVMFNDLTSLLLTTPLKDFEELFSEHFIKPGRGVLLAKKFVDHAIRDVENLSIGMVHYPMTFQVSRRERKKVRAELIAMGKPFGRVKGSEFTTDNRKS